MFNRHWSFPVPKMATGRSVRLLLLSLTLLLSGSAFAQLTPVKMGGQYPPIFEYVYRHYAIEGGFMEEQGIDAEFVGFTAGLTGLQALVSGSVQFACEGMAGTLSAMREGSDLRIVVIVNADNTYVIVTNPEIEEPQDLRGKRWAVSRVGAVSQTYAQFWLDAYGLEEGSVEWVPIGGNTARARALIAGQVDAALLTLGEYIRVRDQSGVKFQEYLADVVPPLPISACSTSAQMIEDNPEIVQAYVNATLNSVRFARTEEGRAGYLEASREHDPTEYTEEEFAELYEQYLGKTGSLYAVDPNGGMYPEVIHSNMQLLVDDGTLDEMLPLERVWDPSFVNNYLAENGWYDVRTQEGGLFLRDLTTR